LFLHNLSPAIAAWRRGLDLELAPSTVAELDVSRTATVELSSETNVLDLSLPQSADPKCGFLGSDSDDLDACDFTSMGYRCLIEHLRNIVH